MTKKEGFESLGDRGVTVVIDKNLTPELIEEGNVREIISKIQTMRKDSGFEVMDNIKVAFIGNEKVSAVALRNKDEIMADTLQLLGKKSDNPGQQGGYQAQSQTYQQPGYAAPAQQPAPAYSQPAQQPAYTQPSYQQPAPAPQAAAQANLVSEDPGDDLPF